MNTESNEFFKTQVLGHPAGLFVLFFTEMWERFSFYGMRALLVLFLVSSLGLDGWGWPREHALALYGTYLALLYLTPIIGGTIADKYLGNRKAIILGALIMTLGHASMAIESNQLFLYLGLTLLVVGTGFFKPNMSSFISILYDEHPEKKDGAYTIFYMGVNAGAFLGIMLCGYLGETLGWSWGFGLAGIFMLLGLLQFTFAHNIFGDKGIIPNSKLRELEQNDEENNPNSVEDPSGEKVEKRLNPFLLTDKIFIAIFAVLGFTWIINDPLSKIANINLLPFKIANIEGSTVAIIVALISFLIVLIIRTLRFGRIERDRMFAVMVIALLIIFFWASFEQAGGSMSIFAKDYTERVLSGNAANIFNVIDVLITVIPVAIISWVLFLLFRKTIKKYLISNLILALCFILIWGLIYFKINTNFNTYSYEVNYPVMESTTIENGEKKTKNVAITSTTDINLSSIKKTEKTKIREAIDFSDNQKIFIVDVDKKGKSYKYLKEEKAKNVSERIEATVIKRLENKIEIPVTWFLILNSLFIIAFAPLFSKWWESKYNPSPAFKYAIGLFLLGIGFAFLAFGAGAIPKGAQTASVSLVWLVMAYLFHTLGELCVSPVGLSYVSKLVPARMVAFMFGVWYLALAIGNKLSGVLGGLIDPITEKYSIGAFFLIFTFVPIGIGVIAIVLNPLLKRLMHGVK